MGPSSDDAPQPQSHVAPAITSDASDHAPAPADHAADAGTLINAALLQGLSPGPEIGSYDAGDHTSVMAQDAHAYDAHVPLAMHADGLPDIGATLDHLVSSHHLFDVPALDLDHVPGDAGHT